HVMRADVAQEINLASLLVHPYFRNEPDEGREMATECNAAADCDVTVLLIVARRWPLLPAIAFRRDAHRVAIARVAEIAQPEIDRVCVGGGRHLVDERLRAEQNWRPIRIAQMRGPQRRGALHERRDRLPAEPAMVERVRRDRDLEALRAIERQPEKLS